MTHTGCQGQAEEAKGCLYIRQDWGRDIYGRDIYIWAYMGRYRRPSGACGGAVFFEDRGGGGVEITGVGRDF